MNRNPMSAYPSVSKSVFRSVHKSLKVPPALVGGVGVTVQNHNLTMFPELSDETIGTLSRLLATNAASKSSDTIRASNQADNSSPVTTNEYIHPSVVVFPESWNGYKYWMCIEAYPSSAEAYENPSIMATNDDTLVDWEEPPGVTNPIAPKPANVTGQGDAYLAYDDVSDKLVIVYINTLTSGSVRQTLISDSSDGVTWSTPEVVLSGVQTGSPCLVIYKDGGVTKYRLTYGLIVGGTTVEMKYRERTDGYSGSWSSATQVDIAAINVRQVSGSSSDRILWDNQYYRLDSGEWLISQVLATSSNGSGALLFLGYSQDDLASVTYFKNPILSPSAGWGNVLTYTTALVAIDDIKLINTSMGTGNLWGKQTVVATETAYDIPAPLLCFGKYPRDYSGSAVKVHGQKYFEFTLDGSGSITTDAKKGMALPAGRGLSSTLDGFDSAQDYTFLVECSIDTNAASVPDGTYVDVCSVGGLRIGFRKWPAQSNWLVEIRDPSSNVLYQPEYIPHGIRCCLSLSRSGVTMRYGTDAGSAGAGITSLSFAQTTGITLGSASNGYGINIRGFAVYEEYQTSAQLVNVSKWDHWALTNTAAVPTFEMQPSNTVVQDGSTAIFECVPYGYPGPTLQWQSSVDGSSWSDISGQTSLRYSRAADVADDGLQIRCVATNSSGSTNSSAVTMNVIELAGGYWQFDGTNDHATTSGLNSAANGVMTFAAWVRPTSVGSLNSGGGVCLFGDFDGSGGNAGFGLLLNRTSSSAKANRLIAFVGGNPLTPQPLFDLEANKWQHIAVVRSGSSGSWVYTWYLNGAYAGYTSTATNPSSSGVSPVLARLGSYNGFYSPHAMKDARFFTSAKTASEILAIANGDADNTGVAFRYEANETSGTTGEDSSTTNNDATLVNTSAGFFNAF